MRSFNVLQTPSFCGEDLCTVWAMRKSASIPMACLCVVPQRCCVCVCFATKLALKVPQLNMNSHNMTRQVRTKTELFWTGGTRYFTNIFASKFVISEPSFLCKRFETFRAHKLFLFVSFHVC